VILTWSVIKTRQKNIGLDTEYTNDDPKYSEFFLDSSELDTNDNDFPQDLSAGEEAGDKEPGESETTISITPGDSNPSHDNQSEEPKETGEQIDPNTDYTTIYDQFEVEDDEENYKFDKIVDHFFQDGVLILKVRYQGIADNNVMDVPFPILRKDVPLELARYVRLYVIDERRKGFYNDWAAKVIKDHTCCIRRLHKAYNIGATMRIHHTRRAKQNRMSKNARNAKQQNQEKYGIEIPRNTREALLFDLKNNNMKWADAIAKEMGSLERLNVFEYRSATQQFGKTEGWQHAPMHMIFDIKQDLRHKARLVVGGHMIDSSGHNTYSSTISDLSVRLLLTVLIQNGLDMMVGDIGNAFPTAPCAEKIWSKAGPEFGSKEGSTVILKRALYGLKTASRSFHEFFGDCLRRMGFILTRADQDLWYKKSTDYEGYDYIATHVDDIIIAAKRPIEYMTMIEQEFVVRNKEDSPSYYLGNNIKRKGKYLHVSNKKYITEILRKYQEKHGCLRKENIPMAVDAHPECDKSSFLKEDGIAQFQHIIGICQWLIVAGRFDINYAVSSLSRYAAAPREEHLVMAKKVLGYLKKYPKRGYVVNPEPPIISAEYQKMEIVQDFGGQYSYYTEDLDPRFPEPLLDELAINVFADADHAHDKITGRSITGILAMVGSTPTIWKSKRQTAVQTSTFGAEFTALKTAVEEAITLRYHLCSMGVKVSKETVIYVDNMGVVLNATNPGSTLNKKHIALAYHFVREHVAGHLVEIRKISTADNYGDAFTKALSSHKFNDFFYELQCN